MKTIGYKLQIELNPQDVTAKNLKQAESEILETFERVISSHKINRRGMFLKVVKVEREGASEKTEWQEFKESLRIRRGN